MTEDAALTAALIDPHNSTGPSQGKFRVGHFDAVAHRYAAEVRDAPADWPAAVGAAVGAPVVLTSNGPTAPGARADLRIATARRMAS